MRLEEAMAAATNSTETSSPKSHFDNPEEFAHQVEAALNRRGATKSALAIALGVSRQRVDQILNQGWVTGSVVRRIADILEMQAHVHLVPDDGLKPKKAKRRASK